MTNRQQGATEHSRWAAFYQSFRESNYITDFWNWLMTLTSKAAEMVLFGSVLYSGYELIPGVAHAPAEVDAMIFVIQQGALDVGGMGLLKLARRAGLPRDSFPMRVGIILVSLMIANVILASVKQTLPMTPGWVLVSLETLLLVARAVMAVLFGHAIHALREEYGESMITVQEARVLQGRLEELTQHLSETVQQVQQQWAQELAHMQQSLQQQLATAEQSLHKSLHESSGELATNVQEQLARELATVHESVQGMQGELAQVSSLQVQIEEVKALYQCQERGRESVPPQKGEERPILHVVAVTHQQHGQKSRPRRRSERPTAGKFDAQAFVFACLRENGSLKLTDIQKQAHAQGYELSEATISRYRKQFVAQLASSHESLWNARESESESLHESSTLQDASSHINASLHESVSFYDDESYVAGA